MFGYIYILKLREHIKSGEDVYKVGRTQNIVQRKRGYPKGSSVLYQIYTNDIINQEYQILQQLKPFKLTEYGNEYFGCNISHIEQVILSVCNLHDFPKTNQEIESNEIENDIDSSVIESIITKIKKKNDTDKSQKYVCPRCDYETSIITHYIAHLNRKNICKDINESNISPKTIIESLLLEKNNKEFECDVCNTKYTANKSLKRHHKTCNGTKRSNTVLEKGLKLL
jgi:hypothetical protein